jgi:hypothetical protein
MFDMPNRNLVHLGGAVVIIQNIKEILFNISKIEEELRKIKEKQKSKIR